MSERERSSEEAQAVYLRTHDREHRYRGYWTDDGLCRLRIYQAEQRTPVVICSELPENTNTSITNMCKYLVADVARTYFPERIEEDEPLVWIEQYPYGVGRERRELPEFSIVTFEDFRPRVSWLGGEQRVRVGQPRWRHVDRADVAELLGIPEDELD